MYFDDFFMVGSEKEVKAYRRILDFGDDKRELNYKYNQLKVSYQECVNHMIRILNRNEDFLGYNLNCIINAYKKGVDADKKVPQLKMSRFLAFTALYYGTELSGYDEDDKVRMDQQTQYVNLMLQNAKKALSLNKITKNTMGVLKNFCSNFLLDFDLLKDGIGKIWDINEVYFEDYIHNAEFQKIACENPDETWNVRLRAEFYENYLKKSGKLVPNQPVLIERWAVLTYSGMYQKLNPPAKGNRHDEKQKAVDALIEDLYDIQTGKASSKIYAELLHEII